MTVIKLIDVSKTYRKRVLFSGVHVAIEPGTSVGLVGPNGSGKSVLLRIMCGFVTPDSGQALIDRACFDEGALFPAAFGVLIDRPGYIAHATGLENLLRLASIRKKIGEDTVRAWMQRLDLDPGSSTRLRNYSLGMKQKLAIAQAVMEGQRVLVLDEPFNALDESSARTVREIMHAHRERGGTIVFTSHDRRDITDLADRTLVIDGERVREVSS